MARLWYYLLTNSVGIAASGNGSTINLLQSQVASLVDKNAHKINADQIQNAVLLQATSWAGVGTFDVVVQTSPDGTNWITLKAFAQINAAATELLLANTVPLLNYVRASWTKGGANPSCDLQVKLFSSEKGSS